MKYPEPKQLTAQQLNLYQNVNRSKSWMLRWIFDRSCAKATSIPECLFNNNPIIQNNSVTYYTTSSNVSVWQGMASYPDSNNPLIISGTTSSRQGVIYIGNISTNSPTGKFYIFSVPGAQNTSAYGPRYDPSTGYFTIVGSYSNPDNKKIYGFMFRGTLSDFTNPNNYILQMNYTTMTPYTETFSHSTYGNFVVGNSANVQYLTTDSWIYNITDKTYTQYVFPSDKTFTTTLYGIVQNANGTYTLAGGYSTVNNNKQELEYGFIVDMDSNCNFSNETSIQYAKGILTHFEGISTTSDADTYTLAGDSFSIQDLKIGFAMKVVRDSSTGTFVVKDTVKINYDDKTTGKTTSNSIFENNVVGLFLSNPVMPFQATISNFV